MTEKLLAPTLILIVFSVVGLTVPTAGVGVLQQSALAQPVVDDVDADTLIQETRDEVEQEIEQDAEQDAEQTQEQDQSNDQSADQSNTADVSQDESNEQANVIETGDNTAATTQVGENAAVDNAVAAESEGGDSGDAEADKDSEASTSGGDSGDAEAELEQSVSNEATTIQDSSADGNILSNENEFGDDIAVVDQDNIADQDAANVGIQDQDLTQTIDQIQQAANLNVDFDVQVGVQQELPPPPPPTIPPEEVFFCFTTAFGITPCFQTLEECEEGREITRNNGLPVTECREERNIDPFEPPRSLCTVEGTQLECRQN